MKLRSIGAMLLTVMLLVSLVPTGLAQSTVASSLEIEARDISFNKVNNMMAVLKVDADHYVLMDAAGNELTTAPYTYMDEEEGFFKVMASEDTNGTGLIDAAGNEVLPMQYGDVECISDRWLLGVVLTEATSENYDYKSFWGNGFYLVDHYDLYFGNKLVGAFERTAYDYASAYGNYIFIKDRDGNYTAYDSEMNQSAYEFSYPGEYDEDYSSGTVYHIASNQQAFTADCTLTADDVERSIWYAKGTFYDLQGNVLFEEQNRYDTVNEFKGDYARVKLNGYYGLIDREGNEVVPCEYDQIYCNDEFLASGYQVVVKDGKLGYVNTKGEVTCDFTYGESNGSSSSSPFNQIKNLDGNIILLSGAIGELPEQYKEASRSFVDTCPVAAVVNAEDLGGVIDLQGKVVVPFDAAYDSTYDLTISNDGSVILGSRGSRMYTVYTIAHEAASLEAAAADEAAALVCTNCSYAPAEGETPNFCPECGTKFE